MLGYRLYGKRFTVVRKQFKRGPTTDYRLPTTKPIAYLSLNLPLSLPQIQEEPGDIGLGNTTTEAEFFLAVHVLEGAYG